MILNYVAIYIVIIKSILNSYIHINCILYKDLKYNYLLFKNTVEFHMTKDHSISERGS